MSAIRLTGSTSGYAEITPSAIAGDVQLVLPSTAGTLDRLNRAGNVLQVVSATYSTYTAIVSTSYTDTGLSASITPSSASSKVLVFVSHQLSVYRSTNDIVSGSIRLVRGSTSILVMERSVALKAGTASDGSVVTGGRQGIVYLDSPATTSSVTYKTQGLVNTTSNSGELRINDYEVSAGNSASTITLVEVAA